MDNKKLTKKLERKISKAGCFVEDLFLEKIDESIKKLEDIKFLFDVGNGTTEDYQKEIFMAINILEHSMDILKIMDELEYYDELTDEEKDELFPIVKNND